MNDPRVGEVWRHRTAGPVGIHHCPGEHGPAGYLVLNSVAEPMVVRRWELTAPAGYDETVEFGLAMRRARKREETEHGGEE